MNSPRRGVARSIISQSDTRISPVHIFAKHAKPKLTGTFLSLHDVHPLAPYAAAPPSSARPPIKGTPPDAPHFPIFTWSNPTGLTITPLSRPNVYIAERAFCPRLPGLRKTDVGTKMAIVKLPTGGLWVHSPFQPTPDLLQELTPTSSNRRLCPSTFPRKAFLS